MAETKVANLALQGGGSHGAFTWGVLERLLQEPGLKIDGVSATSAGAINAAVLAHGAPPTCARERFASSPAMRSAWRTCWRPPCLPNFSQAVEIDGEYFWDGGYMGNPALFPLIYGCQSCDIIVVHINPTERPEIPRTAQGIINRINEISFNSSLFREMRAIAFVSKLIDEGKITDGSLKRMLIHAIDADDVMQGLGPMSKLNADWDFLMHLHDIGRERADRWLKSNLGMLGIESTVDIRAKYL